MADDVDVYALAERVLNMVVARCVDAEDKLECVKRYRMARLRDAFESMCGKKRSLDVFKPGPVLSILLEYCGKLKDSDWEVFWYVYKHYFKGIVERIRYNTFGPGTRITVRRTKYQRKPNLKWLFE